MNSASLLHEPLQPLRENFIGERVILQEWQSLMASDVPFDDASDGETWLDFILAHLSKPTQRHATVAASFVTWLGTSCGLSFVIRARKAAQLDPQQPGLAWVGEWAKANLRCHGVSYGFRTVEYVLAEPDNRTSGSFSGLKSRTAYSADDLEVIDHLCNWMGSNAGTEFLNKCEAKINEQRA